jgi:hypothetical protein
MIERRNPLLHPPQPNVLLFSASWLLVRHARRRCPQCYHGSKRPEERRAVDGSSSLLHTTIQRLLAARSRLERIFCRAANGSSRLLPTTIQRLLAARLRCTPPLPAVLPRFGASRRTYVSMARREKLRPITARYWSATPEQESSGLEISMDYSSCRPRAAAS